VTSAPRAESLGSRRDPAHMRRSSTAPHTRGPRGPGVARRRRDGAAAPARARSLHNPHYRTHG
jgi:hypothetical protein